MKIVVFDEFTLNPGDLSWQGLKSLGDLFAYDRMPADQIALRIEGVAAVFTNKTPLPSDTI